MKLRAARTGRRSIANGQVFVGAILLGSALLTESLIWHGSLALRVAVFAGLSCLGIGALLAAYARRRRAGSDREMQRETERARE